MSLRADLILQRGSFSLQAAFDVEPGTVVAVLGPNGAGKSTLLRALAGLERIDRGCIEAHGRVVDDGATTFVPAQGRSVGFVFQDYALFPHLTVLENVAFGLRAQGVDRATARRRARELAARLRFDEVLDRRPGAISGGQAQRVALARALATGPRTLLLDEPLAALDAETRAAVREHLQSELLAFAGCTVLVTHDALDAMLLADRVLVLEGGRIVQEGTPHELAQRPTTTYAAALFGVTLLRGMARDGALALDEGGTLHIADTALAGQALAMVRPESVVLHRQRPEGSARNVWPGTVTTLQRAHDRVLVGVAGSPSVTAALTPAAVAELRVRVGEQVWLSVKAMEISAYPAPHR